MKPMSKRIKVLPRQPRWGLPGLPEFPELPEVYIEVPEEINLKFEGIDVVPDIPLPKVVIKFKAND